VNDGAFCELAELPRWLCWREEQRGGKPTKVPYAPATGGLASATDPKTWVTRWEADNFAREFLDGQAGGLGITLGNISDGVYLVPLHRGLDGLLVVSA
jgi:primase-polymerase (primpol)-like protein